MKLPPHLILDLVRVIMMQVMSVFVVWKAVDKLYDIDLFDFQHGWGKATAAVISIGTFVGLYQTISSGERLKTLGDKVIHGEEKGA
jgi:hypothetical protein